MEGPSLVLLQEEAHHFVGKRIDAATGDARLDFDRIGGQRLQALRSWGKHLLLVLDDCTLRIHYLMFGNYYIDSRHPIKSPKLSLYFGNGQWHNYNCAVRILDTVRPDDLYDWSVDVMSDTWNPQQAEHTICNAVERQVDDLLLDQHVFSGVGNIIKKEVLYRVGVHPESIGALLPAAKQQELVAAGRHYCFQFLDWKKEGTLRRRWLAHTQKICTRCNLPLTQMHTGHTPRRSFFCIRCQVLYQGSEP